MNCPKCGWFESKVIDSRPNTDDSTVKRRRECKNCMYRYTTKEIIVGGETDMYENEKRVHDRKSESWTGYYDIRTMESKEGYNVDKLTKVCNEEGTTVGRYVEYLKHLRVNGE